MAHGIVTLLTQRHAKIKHLPHEQQLFRQHELQKKRNVTYYRKVTKNNLTDIRTFTRLRFTLTIHFTVNKNKIVNRSLVALQIYSYKYKKTILKNNNPGEARGRKHYERTFVQAAAALCHSNVYWLCLPVIILLKVHGKIGKPLHSWRVSDWGGGILPRSVVLLPENIVRLESTKTKLLARILSVESLEAEANCDCIKFCRTIKLRDKISEIKSQVWHRPNRITLGWCECYSHGFCR